MLILVLFYLHLLEILFRLSFSKIGYGTDLFPFTNCGEYLEKSLNFEEETHSKFVTLIL